MNDLGGGSSMFKGMAPTSHLDELLDTSKSGLSANMARQLSFQDYLVIPPYSSPLPDTFPSQHCAKLSNQVLGLSTNDY